MPDLQCRYRMENEVRRLARNGFSFVFKLTTVTSTRDEKRTLRNRAQIIFATPGSGSAGARVAVAGNLFGGEQPYVERVANDVGAGI